MILRCPRAAGDAGVGAGALKDRGPKTEDRASWFNADSFLNGLRRINIFCGGFGSGKTEVAVNFSLRMSELGRRVSIADLDIVNLYFRSREVREQLRGCGIDVIVPSEALVNADLPIIVPEVKGAIEGQGMKDEDGGRGSAGRSQKSEVRRQKAEVAEAKGETRSPNDEGPGTKDEGTTPVVVLDLGGDPAGARVMASLAGAMKPDEYSGLFVLNSRRPFTATVAAAQEMMSGIADASGIKVDRIVVNSHLVDETTPAVVDEGTALGEALAQATGASIAFVAVQRNLLDRFDAAGCKYPVMVLDRLMLKPWEPSNWIGRYRLQQ